MKQRINPGPYTLFAISFFAAFMAIFSSCAKTGARSDSAGGLSWTPPAKWSIGPTQQMRTETYLINPINGDKENADCAVFYFGKGIGGNKGANLDRWANQFEQPDGRNSSDVASIKEMKANGLSITAIELTGIYKKLGPSMEIKERKLGYQLLGAIIDGPEGLVFFKLVGPEKTVSSAQDDFMNMINSIKAGS
jgi:hypothetical protein